MKTLFSWNLLLLIVFGGPACLTGAQQSVQAQRWEVVDFDFVAPIPSNTNPFDISFGAVLHCPGQQSLTLPGFYKGHGVWAIRASAPKSGAWSGTTFSSLPELSGHTITLNASQQGKGKGPIAIDPKNPQRFTYSDGSPYFALAFELDWLFALDYGNDKSLPKSQQLLDTVAAHGFNQVVMNVYAHDVGWKTDPNTPKRYDFSRPSYGPFAGSHDQPDFSQLNTGFFDHLDRVMDELNQRNIVSHLMIYVWNKKVNWPDMYTAADNRFFDYVIARYQAYPNVLWDVSKEALDYGRCDPPYIHERISRIRKNDTYNRLVTVHDYGYCREFPEKVDFISIQNWKNYLYMDMLAAEAKHSDKPVMNIEHGGYEKGPFFSFAGNYTSPEVCLERNYLCLFAGTYSSYYWQDTSWNIVVYDPFDSPDVPVKPRFDFYQHLAALFKKYNFNDLYPVRDYISSSSYILSNGDDLFLMLVPEDNIAVNLVLPKPMRSKIQTTWFNIYTGKFQETDPVDYHHWKELRSPWPDGYSIAIVRYDDEL